MFANKILDKARSFIGVKENPPGSNKVSFNTNYYGREVGGVAYPWCVTFVWDVFRLCGASSLFYDGRKTAYCPTVESWGKNNGLTVAKNKGQKGDLILFDFNGKGVSGHIGIIEKKNDDGSYTTIEGNTGIGNDANGGSVMRRTRNQSVVRCIIRPKYQAESTVATLEQAKKYVGNKVTELQTKLIKLGYNCGNGKADGSFGNGTYQSLLKFQKDNGLKADAYAGNATFAKLNELIAKREAEAKAKKEAEAKAKKEAEEKAKREAEAKAIVSAIDTVKEIQNYLNKFNNAGLSVDGDYGKKTKTALIKYWQKTVGGLVVDGSFGAKSQAKASAHNLQKGDKGKLVTIMQMTMICEGYSFGSYGADGSFGQTTKDVVIKYQKDHKLSADGQCGKATWTSLLG